MDTVPEFHAKAPEATVSGGLAQYPCVMARAGAETVTLRTKGVDSTKAPSRPIHSGYFYSASSSPLLLIGALNYSIDTVSDMLKRYRQLRVKDLTKVPTWWLEWDSNL